MKDHINKAIDARQTSEWGNYLQQLGWDIEWVGKTQLFIRKLPLLNNSIIKIQHAQRLLDFKKIDHIAHKRNALAVIIEPHTFGYHERSYLTQGYQKSKNRFAHSATIKIDLIQSEEKLFKSFSENAKRNIKKAINNKLVIK